MNAVEIRNAQPPDDRRHARAVQARAAYARRDAIFGGDAELFGDPAWDILLALYVARDTDGRAAVSEIGLSAYVPSATALRHLQELERRGLVERCDAAGDGAGTGRAMRFTLSARGRAALDCCFAD